MGRQVERLDQVLGGIGGLPRLQSAPDAEVVVKGGAGGPDDQPGHGHRHARPPGDAPGWSDVPCCWVLDTPTCLPSSGPAHSSAAASSWSWSPRKSSGTPAWPLRHLTRSTWVPWWSLLVWLPEGQRQPIAKRGI